jgi:hypothetical protein
MVSKEKKINDNKKIMAIDVNNSPFKGIIIT